jgi:hypothetical protein
MRLGGDTLPSFALELAGLTIDGKKGEEGGDKSIIDKVLDQDGVNLWVVARGCFSYK